MPTHHVTEVISENIYASNSETPVERQRFGRQVMAASTLTGDRVVNAEGDRIGNIVDIMLDVSSGRVAYAVLSFGGFFADKLFAIPWGALTLDEEEQDFILDVDKDKLANAPGFDKEHWLAHAQDMRSLELHSYYGVEPYWQ